MPSRHQAGSRADRWIGWLLFLPVPIVLVLFTRLPIGPYPSVGLGLLLMLTHPLYARPWAVRRAPARCLWCGTTVGGDPGGDPGGESKAGRAAQRQALRVTDPRGTVEWGSCSATHRALSARALATAWRMRPLLRMGILGAIVISLLGVILGAAQQLGSVTTADATAFFRFVVALSVLPLGWFGMPLSSVGSREAGIDAVKTARAPFPLHIAALPGIAAVLWLFRLIGMLWLVQGARHLGGRLF